MDAWLVVRVEEASKRAITDFTIPKIRKIPKNQTGVRLAFEEFSRKDRQLDPVRKRTEK